MSKTSKDKHIQHLEFSLAQAYSRISELEHELEIHEERVLSKDVRIQELYNEIDQLIHTPEFAADTKSAFDRGRQDGVRSISSKATSDLLGFANELNGMMNDLANKYTRNLTLDVFLGTVEPVEEVKKLPVTDFTESILHNAHKCF